MHELEPRQIQAATLLASGKTCKDTASAINCTPETISHWKKDPNFEALLNQLKWEALEAGREKIRSVTLDIANELIELAQSAKSEAVKRKACMDILTIVGVNDAKSGMYGWGIGETTPEDVRMETKRKELLKQSKNQWLG